PNLSSKFCKTLCTQPSPASSPPCASSIPARPTASTHSPHCSTPSASTASASQPPDYSTPKAACPPFCLPNPPPTVCKTRPISARSFLESVFIPAGALRRFDDGTFCIFEDAFDAIQVGTLDTAAQNNLLQRFLSDLSDQHRVA